MRRGPTGTLVTVSTPGERVEAFVPAPLPPSPPLVIDGRRQRRLERAQIACGRLDALTTLLPQPDLFLYAYVRREAVLSSQIEGTQSSISDLLIYEIDGVPGAPFDDVVEVSNYVRALEYGIERLKNGFPLCNRLIRELHGILLQRGRGADRQPGVFRRTQNWIGARRPSHAAFIPPPPERVEECMADLETFLHDPDTPGALVKAALAHVQFETIHPFLDGNGRVGRLLIALILFAEGVLREPILYLSLYFKQHREEYYELLNRVRFEGDWEAWVDFFLEGVAETANGAVETAKRLVALFDRDRARIGGRLGRAAPNALRVFDVFRRRPIATIPLVVRRIGRISYPTVARAIDRLVEMGILREVTQRKRDRIFVYGDYVEILNEGAEPP